MQNDKEVVILSLLERRPMYGYEITSELERLSQGIFRFKEVTLYATLHRMASEELVEAKWGDTSKGARRKYYYITEKGQKVLSNSLCGWHEFRKGMDLVLGSR